MSNFVMHHSDFDGQASGAVLNLFLTNAKCCPVDYNHVFPFDEIKKNDTVYIVDYSLSEEDFKKLLKLTKNVIWIDHHQSAIEGLKDTEIEKLDGIREIGRAGCELAWEYCFKDDEIPEIIHRIGRFDVWDMEAFGEEETDAFICGLRLFDTDPKSDNWEKWIENPETIDDIIDKGYVAKDYRDKFYAEYVEAFGFEATLSGYKAYCCNIARTGKFIFNSIDIKKYDIVVIFSWDGESWNFSVYSEKDNVDCATICEKFGGGGHHGAAGMQITGLENLPFKKVKRDETLE